MPNPFETLGLAPSFALDPALLEQRQRELLDQARREKNRERLLELKAQMSERRAQVEAGLGQAFEPLLAYAAQRDARASRGPEADAAQRLFAELKYVRRFGEEVAAIEDEL